MTDAQKFGFYFPAWRQAVLANEWRMEKKRLVIAEDRLTEEGRKVVVFGRQRAAQENRGPTIEDLRHGAHILALGRDKSSEDLNNAEVDRVVTLFRLLADPEDLAARLKWDAYQRGEDPGSVKRIEWFIEHAAPEEYVRAIAADKYGTRTWENLTLGQKRSLAMTLAARKKSKAQSPKPKVGEAGLQTSDFRLQTVPDDDDPDWSVE